MAIQEKKIEKGEQGRIGTNGKGGKGEQKKKVCLTISEMTGRAGKENER